MYRPIVVTGFFFVLSACSSTPPASVSSTPISTVIFAAPKEMTKQDARNIEKLNQELAARSIYFPYDEFLIDLKYQSTIKQNAELVKSVPGIALILEGNADERGGGEYNLALGQKRADMVRKALGTQGVPESKTEAISLGKEKPKALCHEESCWSQNRRVDFVVKAVDSKQ